MAERRPSLIFRFAGLLTLAMLAVMTLAYGFLAPTPEVPGTGLDGPAIRGPSSPEWDAAKAWITAHPGYALVICRWPTDLPRGGRIALGPDDAPSFWDDGSLIQAVPEDERGGVVLAPDGAARAWTAFAGGTCEVIPPASVRVDGRVVGATGAALAEESVEGCGQNVTTDADGVFRLSLSHPALLSATADDKGRPRCDIGRASGGSTRTPIDLARGGVQPIVVQ